MTGMAAAMVATVLADEAAKHRALCNATSAESEGTLRGIVAPNATAIDAAVAETGDATAAETVVATAAVTVVVIAAVIAVVIVAVIAAATAVETVAETVMVAEIVDETAIQTETRDKSKLLLSNMIANNRHTTNHPEVFSLKYSPPRNLILHDLKNNFS